MLEKLIDRGKPIGMPGLKGPRYFRRKLVRGGCDLGQTESTYGSATSHIGADTTGLPAARYSGVFVGLIYRVGAFNANGSIATSQCAI